MPHEGGNSFVQVGSGYTASQYSANVTAGHSGHDQGIIQWLKTNETVHAVLQKAKVSSTWCRLPWSGELVQLATSG